MTKAQHARLKLRAPQLLPRDVALDFPPGWFDLVFDTCVTLNNHLVTQIAQQAAAGHLTIPRVIAIACRYGKLRFHVEQADETMRSVIRDAEQASIHLCMCCGRQGHQQRRRDTLVTFCEQHLQVS